MLASVRELHAFVDVEWNIGGGMKSADGNHKGVEGIYQTDLLEGRQSHVTMENIPHAPEHHHPYGI